MTDEMPAGFYDDPGGGDRRRFWDGSAWTDHLEGDDPPAVVPLVPPPARSAARLGGGVKSPGWSAGLLAIGILSLVASGVLGLIGLIMFGYAADAQEAVDQLRPWYEDEGSINEYHFIAFGFCTAAVIAGLLSVAVIVMAGAVFPRRTAGQPG